MQKRQMQPQYIKSTALADGTPIIVPMLGAPQPATVWVRPVAGDTVAVSYSVDGGETYVAWSNGPVTNGSDDILKELAFYSGITHVKFERTGGAGTTSTYGIS